MSLFSIIRNPLPYLAANPVAGIFVKEVVGTNAPKSGAALFRTYKDGYLNKDEALDVAAGQFGGTAAFFGSGFLWERFLKDDGRAGFSTYINKLGNQVKNPTAAKGWAMLGKSFSIFMIQGALYWAIPFMRNYLTAKRTQKTDYSQIIGAGQKQDSAEAKAELQKQLKYYKGMALKIATGGVLASVLPVLLGRLAIRQNWQLPKLGKWLVKKVALEAGDKAGSKLGTFAGYKDPAAFLFVALASYLGWFHAVRDKYEIKEQMFHFASFLFGFFGVQHIVNSLFMGKHGFSHPKYAPVLQAIAKPKIERGMKDRILEALKLQSPDLKWESVLYPKIEDALKQPGLSATKKTLLEDAERLLNRKDLAGYLISVFVLALSPTAINWALTKRRIARDKAQEKLPVAHLQAKPAAASPPSSPAAISSIPVPALQPIEPTGWMAPKITALPQLTTWPSGQSAPMTPFLPTYGLPNAVSQSPLSPSIPAMAWTLPASFQGSGRRFEGE